MRERISCTSSRIMLMSPEKALLVKLYYQNEECMAASAALSSYRHTKGRTLRCYPYKIHRHHELLPGDSVNRRAFAVWAFQKMAKDDDWLSNLLWTDEAHFTLRGSVNTHNCRIKATENPRTVVETSLHDEKVTV
ncbi:DUF4817 domain-containing protein [Trichonephila clavipes]|nr:DUF4817 domain-containing protein [Trichonephila clavipes]